VPDELLVLAHSPHVRRIRCSRLRAVEGGILNNLDVFAGLFADTSGARRCALCSGEVVMGLRRSTGSILQFHASREVGGCREGSHGGN